MSSPEDSKGKMLPRDAAGSIDLDGGTGGITAMCSCDEFLEVYKEDRTFRVKTPESIDPARTNPNAPFVAEVVDTVGSSSPVVARVFLQGHDIINAAIFDRAIDKTAILRHLHAAKESLVVCEKVAKRVGSQIDTIIAAIRDHGLTPASDGRTLNPFPQVAELETEATTFLIHTKRAIRTICHLPSLFLPVKRKDSNFETLLKSLSKTAGVSASLTDFVRDNAGGVRYLVELRNFQEHPDAKKTTVDNFKVMPSGSISRPMWYVSGETPRSIREEMFGAVDFLTQMMEAMLIHLVMGAVGERIPFFIEQIPDANIDPKMPIRYRLSIDTSKMKIVVPEKKVE